jgi:hypothetical protein
MDKYTENETKELEKLFDPNGETMKSINEQFNKAVDFIELSWWKKLLVKLNINTL